MCAGREFENPTTVWVVTALRPHYPLSWRHRIGHTLVLNASPTCTWGKSIPTRPASSSPSSYTGRLRSRSSAASTSACVKCRTVARRSAGTEGRWQSSQLPGIQSTVGAPEAGQRGEHDAVCTVKGGDGCSRTAVLLLLKKWVGKEWDLLSFARLENNYNSLMGAVQGLTKAVLDPSFQVTPLVGTFGELEFASIKPPTVERPPGSRFPTARRRQRRRLCWRLETGDAGRPQCSHRDGLWRASPGMCVDPLIPKESKLC